MVYGDETVDSGSYADYVHEYNPYGSKSDAVSLHYAYSAPSANFNVSSGVNSLDAIAVRTHALPFGTVTVRYSTEDGTLLREDYVSEKILLGNEFDVAEESGVSIEGYDYLRTDGDLSGILNHNHVVTVYYNALPSADPEDIPSEDPSETPAEEPSEAPVEDPSEFPAEDPSETPAEESSEVPAKKPAEISNLKPAEVPAEKPAEVLTEEPVEDKTEGLDDIPAENPVDIPAAGTVGNSAERVVEAPAEVPAAQPENFFRIDDHATPLAGAIGICEGDCLN